MSAKHLLLVLVVISGLAACSSNSRKFTIIGNINGMPGQTVILEQLNANDIITIVDSERSKPDGSFELSGIAPEPGLYRIHFHENKFILLSVDKGNMKVGSDWKTLENYTVIGSPASEHLKNFIIGVRSHLRDFNTMSIVLDTLKAKGNDSILTEAKRNFQDMGIRFTQYVEQYADTAPYLPNVIFAARMLNPVSEGTFIEELSQNLSKRFPGTKMTKEYAEYCMKVSTLHKMHTNTAPIDPGATAPEVSLPTIDGNVVNLSSFRGRYVLLDFWASWCGPCRAENPNVVAAYQKFKDKNFTILGVSLDNNKEAWQRAVQDDNLVWTQVCDLKGWSSTAARQYSVQSIPSNFLIDPKGRIIAHNLRGEQLEEELSKVLKTPNP